MIQWTAYGVALLAVMGVERLILNRFPVFGVIPVLLPLALVACTVFEGPKAGAGFGIAVGVLMAAGVGGYWRVILCSAAGLAVGLLIRYVLRHDFVGHLLCCFLLLLLRMVWCVGVRMIQGTAEFTVLFRVGISELLWSMVFAVPIYLLFRFVCCHWGRLYFQ